VPQLFVLSGPQVGRVFDVTSGAVLGRSPGCACVLADRSVSREHARIDAIGGAWRLVDLGSRNGVRVRGERVEEADLVDLDEFQIGEVLLRFRSAAPAPAVEESGFELEEEIVLAPAPQAATAPARAPAPAPTPTSAPALSDRERERARLLAARAPTGLFSGDLAQWPVWMRWSAYLCVLLVLAAAFVGAYWIATR
jgi:predicted component of type VI protein secretion system